MTLRGLAIGIVAGFLPILAWELPNGWWLIASIGCWLAYWVLLDLYVAVEK